MISDANIFKYNNNNFVRWTNKKKEECKIEKEKSK